MTVQSIEADITYTFNDEGQYPFAFDILKPKDVTVQFIDNLGVRHVLAMGTDYLVVDNAGSRYIEIISTCGFIGQPGQLFIFRDMPVEQPTDWVNNEELDMELLEKSFDRIIMILQQFNTQITSELAAITWRDSWKTNIVYEVRDLVQAPNTNIYLATVGHTAGVFEDDLLAGKWNLVIDISEIAGYASAADVARIAAEAAATLAQQHLTNTEAVFQDTVAIKDLAEQAKNAAALSESNAEAHSLQARAEQQAGFGYMQSAQAAASAAEASADLAALSAANLPNATTAGADKILITNSSGDGWDYIAVTDKADAAETEAAIIALEDVPFAYQRGVTLPSIKGYSVAADRAVLVWPRVRVVDHNTGIAHVVPATELNINSPLVWDDGQYATAANRAGRNFCLYLLSDGTLLLSANSIAPIGHTTVNSLKIGGFHCVCVSVGTISGHRLTGFVAGDILPDSVWDLMHRPSCAPSGMVYSQEAGIWVDIYLQSGTGANTASVYGGTITDTRNWMDFVDDLSAVGKRLLSDAEFQIIASGSNEKTSIAGSADPITTGGHIDTAGRRMISNIGCEDCCGALWQWTGEQSYGTDSAKFAWFELPGGKGSIWKQGGTLGDIKLLAGGGGTSEPHCGSRSRHAEHSRWSSPAGVGARGCARSHT